MSATSVRCWPVTRASGLSMCASKLAQLLVGLLVAQQFLYGLKQHGKFTAIDHGAVRQSVR